MHPTNTLKQSALALLSAGLLLCASPLQAQAAPEKEDLAGTYQIQGSDTLGSYTGVLYVTWEWPSMPVGLKAELTYTDGRVRTFRAGGWYNRSKGRISFRYSLQHTGFIGSLPGSAGAKKVKIRGEYWVNAAGTKFDGTSSGDNFSGQDVATRGRPRAPNARLGGTYTVRSNWNAMSRWDLHFNMRLFQSGTANTGDIAGEQRTQCKWLNRDTLQFNVWVKASDSTIVQEVLIARVVNDPAGAPKHLKPIRCYTVTVDLTSSDPSATRVEVQPKGTTRIEQPDGRTLN